MPAWDHVVKLVEAYSGIVLPGEVDGQWLELTTACHRVRVVSFASVEGRVGGGVAERLWCGVDRINS